MEGRLKTENIMNDTLPPDTLIEAALLTQTEPLSEKAMRELCVPPLSADKLIDVLATLKNRWQNRALQLVHTHEGWRFQIAQAAFERLGSLQEQRAPRYSRAVMETLEQLPPLTELGELVLPEAFPQDGATEETDINQTESEE